MVLPNGSKTLSYGTILSLMSPIRLKISLQKRVLPVLLSVIILGTQCYAASMRSGLVPGSENTEAMRSYGSYLSIAMLGMVACLLIFRGREIRSQHPKSFH